MEALSSIFLQDGNRKVKKNKKKVLTKKKYKKQFSYVFLGTKATPFEASMAHASFRLFDGDMHFSVAALNILIKTISSSTRDREKYFLAVTSVRRRMERKW